MAEKTEPSAANTRLLPDQAPLWRIKGGSAILQVDDYGQRVRLKSGPWQSWDSLRRSAQYDLARYGHVQTLDGERIACDWALNDEAVRALVAQQPWKPPVQDTVGFADRLRGALGLAGADGVRSKSTSAPKSPLPLSAFFRGRRAGGQSEPTQQQKERRSSVSWADERPGGPDVADVCEQDETRRWSHGADAAGVGPAASGRTSRSTAADETMEDARLMGAAQPRKPDWTPAFCTQHLAAARVRDATGRPTQDATGVLLSPAPHSQLSTENGTMARAQDAAPPSLEDLNWTPVLDAQDAADARVQNATGSSSHVVDVLEEPATLALRPPPTVDNATLADASDADTAWDCPPGTAAVLFDRGDHDQVLWRPVVVVDFETARETVGSSDVEGWIPVSTGTELRWVDPDELEKLSVTPEAWTRLRSHFAASPPPTPSPTPGDQQWAWLTPTGLGAVVSRTFALPRHAVPHIVGRGGSLIRQIEAILGLIVGVVDGSEGGSTVTVFGPAERVDWAQPVIECVARGGRSILRHLEKMPFD